MEGFMKRWVFGPRKFLLLFGLVLLTGFQCASKPKSDLPVIPLKIDGNALWAEVANKEATQMTGLMFRKNLDWDCGMLFVFSNSATRNFWMRNTYIPLGIAFVDDQGKILNILEMTPLSDKIYSSDGAAKYVLEVNKGWFEKNKVKAGDKIEGLIAAPTPVR